MKQRIIDAFRLMYMRLLGTEMAFYDKLRKCGLINEWTAFKLTGRTFIKLMNVYVKRLEAGTITITQEIEQKFQELDALLDK